MSEHSSSVSSSPSHQQPQDNELTSPTASDRLEIIRQIAFTNQLTVSWEDLRKALKDELEQILESDQLVYTASRVTNPLTTTLTAIPSIIDDASISAGTVTVQEQETSSDIAPTLFASGNSDDDQPHVPEQDQEQQQQKEGEQESTMIVSDSVDKTIAKNQDQTGERMNMSQSQVSKVDAPVETNVTDQEYQEQSDSPTLVDQQDKDVCKNTEKAPEQGHVTDNTAKVVPISTNTLLLETPQGYHDRIKSLLDAFTSAPFTIQRVCELISNPTEHHTNLIKYLRAVEKVLMITSSINEFSNPAYNGISALDEKDDESHGATVNGDYSQSKNLNFSLISANVPSFDNDGNDDITARAIREKEAYDSVLADVDALEAQFPTVQEVRGDDNEGEEEEEEVEEEEVLSTANGAATVTEPIEERATEERATEEMDVDADQSITEGSMTSTMEGVESEDPSEVATEGNMEVDQA
ncbi:Serine/threonine-protein phosphatase 4 regulatory subunit 2 [Linnemannia zychae]|nr:Serine/threonine-protein phosphatase 4 regulatory subunit 2 [Linnemannia zychae]